MKLIKIFIFCISSLLFLIVAFIEEANGIINDERGFPILRRDSLVNGSNKTIPLTLLEISDWCLL